VPAEDVSSAWLRLLKIVLFASIGILLAWIPIRAVPSMLQSLRESRCKKNLQNIAAALALYRNEHGNQFPLWLTALYPKYVATRDTFICPVDRLDGVISAQPEWMKAHDTGRPDDDIYAVYKGADLDGPAGDVDEDKDSFPCSYLYMLNMYEEEAFGMSWSDYFYEQQKERDIRLSDMPVVRCLHHLPPKPPPRDNEFNERIQQEFDESYERPTFNILYNLTFTELRERWWLSTE